MTISRTFGRRVDVLPDIVAFTADAFVQQGIDPRLRLPVDFAVEELFTNMVKYASASTADVQIDVTAIDGGVEVTLTDYDVEPFDVTQAPDADVGLPIEARQPGGLGLHLIRRLVDSIEYEYSNERRQSRVTFRKLRDNAADSGGEAGKGE
jgi:anti-sigma regulatory factor (Ser/Thr protein kinase)